MKKSIISKMITIEEKGNETMIHYEPNTTVYDVNTGTTSKIGRKSETFKEFEPKYKFWRNYNLFYLVSNIIFQFAFYFLIIFLTEKVMKNNGSGNFLSDNLNAILALVGLKVWIVLSNGIQYAIYFFKDNRYENINAEILLIFSIFCSIFFSWSVFVSLLNDGEIGIYREIKMIREEKKFSIAEEAKTKVNRW